MIFLAGVSPKTTVIDPAARLCPVCGLVRARMQRVDHWLSLFFIPVFRVKKGTAVLFCDRCDLPVAGMPCGADTGHHPKSPACSACRQSLQKDHRFCPYCGEPRSPHTKT